LQIGYFRTDFFATEPDLWPIRRYKK